MKHTDNFKQFIAQKAFDEWANNNETFIEDIKNLINEMMMFEMNHGIKILWEIDKSPKKHGDGLEKDFINIIKLLTSPKN